MSTKTFINPLTGRKIKVNGPTHKKLAATGKQAKYWSVVKPSFAQRTQMQQVCPHCFLLPGQKKFPVCTPDCKPNCKGVLAAYRRARQYGYKDVAQKAKLLYEKGCKKKK